MELFTFLPFIMQSNKISVTCYNCSALGSCIFKMFLVTSMSHPNILAANNVYAAKL